MDFSLSSQSHSLLSAHFSTNMTLKNLAFFSWLSTVASFSPSTRINAYSGKNVRNTVTSSTLQAAKSICTFEKSDFALPSGQWPYTAADMGRLDSSDDGIFYDYPRFVTHIDDNAIESLTKFYADEFSDMYKQKGKDSKLDILDLCSSWISHLPNELDHAFSYGRVVGVGMNEEELERNEQLTEYLAKDLNKAPNLSEYEDNSFDFVCNVVSVDYLTNPLEIFKETERILRPGGKCLISFSNRCFATKAVAMWLQADDIGRLTIVASYFHYASENWEDNSIEALDIKGPNMKTPERPSVGEIFKNPSAAFAWANTAVAVTKMNSGDPMFVVRAVKKQQ